MSNAVADYLKQVKLFADLNETQRNRIACACRKGVYRGRSHLFYKGDPGNQLYIVVRGGVKIYDDAEGTGQETTLALLAPGDFFGEMALLTGGERTASAVTFAEETELLRLDQDHFHYLLRDSFELTRALLCNLANRLKQANDELVGKGGTSMSRLAKLLLARMDRGSRQLCPRLSQEEIASMVGVRRETVARNLASMEDNGILLRNRGHIIILRPDRLETMARIA